MYTKIKTKDGAEMLLETQQYELGMYFIINNDPSTQGGLMTTEHEFHTNVRTNIVLEGGQVVDGTKLD